MLRVFIDRSIGVCKEALESVAEKLQEGEDASSSSRLMQSMLNIEGDGAAANVLGDGRVVGGQVMNGWTGKDRGFPRALLAGAWQRSGCRCRCRCRW